MINKLNIPGSVDTAVHNLSAVVEDVYKEAKSFFELEVEVAKKAFESGSTFGNWDGMFNSEVVDLKTQIADNQPYVPLGPGVAANSYSSLLGSIFGGSPLVGQITDPGTGSTSFFDQAVAGSFGTPYGACASTSSIPQALQNITSIVSSKIQGAKKAAQATLGILTSALPDSGKGLAHVMFSLALKLSGAQNILLDQIQDEIKNINEDIKALTDDDYSTDHRLLITTALTHILNADNILQAQLENLLARDNTPEEDTEAKFLFPLNKKGLEQARVSLEKARDTLTGHSLVDSIQGIFSLRSLRIAVRIIYLETLFKLLAEMDERFGRLKLNLGSFDTAFERLTYFDELTIPILQLIRCRLNVIMSDMEFSLEKNQILTFFVKERIWSFELFILIQLLKTTKFFDIDKNKILSSKVFTKPLSSLFEEVNSSDDTVEVSSILQLGAAYIKNVKYKLSYNVNPDYVTRRSDVLNRIIDKRKEENKKLGLVVGKNVLDLEANALSAVQIVASFIAALNTSGLRKSAEMLSEGDIKGFFKSAYEGAKDEADVALDILKDALEEAGMELSDLGNNVTSLYGVMEGKSRSDSLFKEALDGFPETYLKATLQSDSAKPSPINTDII